MSNPARSLRMVGLVGACAVAFSCGGGDVDGGTAGASAGATASAPLSPPVNLGTSIDLMSDGQLWDAGVALNGHWDPGTPQPRTCATGGPGGCRGVIDAIKNYTPGPATVDANGTIVARLRNLGAPGNLDRGSESLYKMDFENGPDAKRYYIIARPVSGGGWNWSVRVAVKGGTTVPPAATDSGSWHVCPETSPHPPGRSAFFQCDTTAGGGLAYDPRDPGWLSCSSGCCTAGQ